MQRREEQPLGSRLLDGGGDDEDDEDRSSELSNPYKDSPKHTV